MTSRLITNNSASKSAAPLHQKCSIAILIVEHSYTVGIPMLNCRYQTAILFWYFC